MKNIYGRVSFKGMETCLSGFDREPVLIPVTHLLASTVGNSISWGS